MADFSLVARGKNLSFVIGHLSYVICVALESCCVLVAFNFEMESRKGAKALSTSQNMHPLRLRAVVRYFQTKNLAK